VLEMVASVAARDLLALARDQAAQVTIDGLSEPIDARVRSVSPALDVRVGSLTVHLGLGGP